MEVLPKYTSDNWQERIGLHKVGLMLAQLGFIFRESSNSDVGIDGQIEYVNNAGEATGKIIAVQIKSGSSYLYDSKSDNNNWTFYPDEKHKYYWEQFPIPVILFVHSPIEEKVYFIDARHYLKINGLVAIKIPKKNVLNSANKNKIFETVGNFDEPFQTIENVLKSMVQKQCTSPLFNLSYFDLFLQGLTNICRQLYFDISIAVDVVECRSPQIAISNKEYEFIYEYVRFLVNQNLADIDFGDCLIEWNERKLVPRFLAPLTYRGRTLLKYINSTEARFFEIMPETHLIQERLMQLVFDNDSFLRIEKALRIQELLRKENTT
jgi:hypothetical protein